METEKEDLISSKMTDEGDDSDEVKKTNESGGANTSGVTEGNSYLEGKTS